MFSPATRQTKPEDKNSSSVITTRRLAPAESKKETGVRSLAQIRQDKMKRLGGSLSQEEGEQGNIKKRIKVGSI